ncbi:prepilin-type N-terminal cleavage/methylation domain-containing protein [Geobacter sp. AOG2]|uniref:prepilin-type N-terminal cleavage/methylation domain-containing protein n=1 Tax=Geobacter sp. AOG2 TaxID=1566347 RepID=UPI001CC47CAA|nr:prepilin-type N-terminal cleavage/methylation domain-containing protein [Geobacter sp. AOG2]GFE59466.1 general secretion pathway protein GspH [Geobacter sp. AOG2]
MMFDRRGFTLIEIVVVLAIIGMVMMLVIPRLPNSEREDLKISARTLASTLRYLQDRATTTGTTYYLHLEPGTDTVKVMQAAGDGSEKEPEDPFLQQRPTKEGVLVADVVIPRLGKLSDGQVRLDIGAGGLRDFVTIHLSSPDGEFWTVMGFPSSGKVKVYQGYQEDAL